MCKGERCDYVPGCGYKIWQDEKEFCFTTDAVFLGNFPHVVHNAKVLELGCGTGAISMLLESRGAAEVTALDVNAHIIELLGRSIVDNALDAKFKLINGDKVKKYKLTGKKVSDLLKLNGTENSDNVKLNYDKSVFLSEIKGDIILQKKKTVSFILAGERAEIETYCETVKEFLKEQSIEIGKSDNLSVEPDSKLVDGMEITLQKVETKTETVTETIPYKTQKENSSSLQSGKTQIKKQGVNGEKLCTYKVTYVDGKAQSRELISSEIIKAPIDQIVLYGTKKVVSSEKPDKTIVSKEDQPDCDGSGHGYYIITYSDGSVEYVDY